MSRDHRIHSWRKRWAHRGIAVLILTIFLFPENAWASETARGWGIWETVGRFFNLALVLGVLVYVLRKPMSQFFEERRQNIHRSIEEANRARQAAEQQLEEMQQRMGRLESELEEIRERARQEAEEERQQLRKQVEFEAERMVSIARREADALLTTATQELRSEAARLAVELAAARIKNELGEELDGRLVERFASQLDKIQ